MADITRIAEDALTQLEAQQRLRSPRPGEPLDVVRIKRDGRELISFSGNGYLALSHNEVVKQAANKALAEYGMGAGASRLVTGEHPLYADLEATIARIKGTEAACVFGSGYLANIGTIPLLVGEEDLVLADKLSHACLLDGIKLSGAVLHRFKHNDMVHLRSLLEKHRGAHRRCLIITETVFSMDGDIAPMNELVALAKEHDAWLMSDDAHGLGVIPQSQRGDICMGTLSKAVGAYGGYVAGPKPLIEWIKSAARSLVFTTALPAPVCAAALEALKHIEQQTYPSRPLLMAQRFTQALSLPQAQSAIVPLIMGE